MRILTILFLMLLPLLHACSQKNAGHVFSGELKNAANLQVLLEQAHFDRSTLAIGKATADGNGKFSIENKAPFVNGLYVLTIGAKKMYFMLDGTENTVDIKGDVNTMARLDLEVKGSETLDCYARIIRDLIQSQLKDPAQAIAFIEKGCNPLMKAFLTTQLLGNNAGGFLNEFKKAAQALNEYQPDSKYSADFNKMVAGLETQIASADAGESIKIGQDAPEISLPGPDGKVRSLSSLKGKVVLLDFWASWCGPCRRENPRVVEVYKKYKAKGFEIFSVSLDGADPRRGGQAEQMKAMEEDGKRKWVAAIKQDGLLWDNHVSDLKNWASAPAATYGVSSIPKTFLIGRDGKIVAVNPRQNLEQELLKVL